MDAWIVFHLLHTFLYNKHIPKLILKYFLIIFMYQFNTIDNACIGVSSSCCLHKYNFRKQDIQSLDWRKITISYK